MQKPNSKKNLKEKTSSQVVMKVIMLKREKKKSYEANHKQKIVLLVCF